LSDQVGYFAFGFCPNRKDAYFRRADNDVHFFFHQDFSVSKCEIFVSSWQVCCFGGKTPALGKPLIVQSKAQ
jgi:hypothetical protein